MNAAPTAHPAPDLLRAFALGRTDAATSAAVLAHVEACPDCFRAASEAEPDSFLGRMRAVRPGGGTAPPDGSLSGLARSLQPPTVAPELVHLPEYAVERELGRGGMGVVYLARNTLMNRREVLKVMGPAVTGRAGAADRFVQEVQAAAGLDHPNVVRAYSVRQAGGSLVFAMEFVEGEDLHKLVQSHGPLPVAHACEYVRQAALGLQHAHEKGMVHRDIKPHNLILHRAGKKHTVKILDFGLAKVDDRPADHGLTREGQALGTPAYMAPEQIKDARSVDTRGDIYALGCTLYFLLVGRPPFQAESLYALFGQHLTVEATPLNHLRPDIPEGLTAVVARMMAKDPAARYQTPAEAAAALTPIVKALRAGGPTGIETPLPRGHKSQAGRRVVVATAVVLAGILTAWAAGTFRVKTKYGTLVVENVPADAEVLVDGEAVTIARDRDRVTVELVPQKPHSLRVVRGGSEMFARDDIVLGTGAGPVRVRVEHAPQPGDETPATQSTPHPTTRTPPPRVPSPGPAAGAEEAPPPRPVAFRSLSGEPNWNQWHKLRFPNSATWKLGAEELEMAYKPRFIIDNPVYSTKRNDYKDFYLRFEAVVEGSQVFFGFRDHPAVNSSNAAYPISKGRGYAVLLADKGGSKNQEWSGHPSGSLFLVGGHGALGTVQPLAKSRKNVWKGGTWNVVEVTALGNRISVVLNGEPVVDFTDNDVTTSSGHLSFTPAGGATLRFRNFVTRKLPAADAPPPTTPRLLSPDPQFVPLFNGKDTSGWTCHPQAVNSWSVRAGLLTAQKERSYLYTARDTYANFHLRAECRINQDGDSGIFFRSDFQPSMPQGYQADILQRVFRKDPTPHGTGSLVAHSPKPTLLAGAPNLHVTALPSWFTMEVVAVDEQVSVRLNGQEVSKHTLPRGYRRAGHIALEHPGPDTVVEYRTVEIKELP